MLCLCTHALQGQIYIFLHPTPTHTHTHTHTQNFSNVFRNTGCDWNNIARRETAEGKRKKRKKKASIREKGKIKNKKNGDVLLNIEPHFAQHGASHPDLYVSAMPPPVSCHNEKLLMAKTVTHRACNTNPDLPFGAEPCAMFKHIVI